MKIFCTYAPVQVDPETGQGLALAVFDAFVDGKDLVVGVTVGALAGPTPEDAVVSEVGQLVLNRLAQYHDFRYPKGPFIVAGVASVGSATQRVRKVLEQAPPECALLLLCADDKVYAKAFAALNVDLQALNAKPQ